jgi:hypothetical protein
VRTRRNPARRYLGCLRGPLQVLSAASGHRQTAPALPQNDPSVTGIDCTSCGCPHLHSGKEAFVIDTTVLFPILGFLLGVYNQPAP